MIYHGSDHPHVDAICDGPNFEENHCQKMGPYDLWVTAIGQQSSRTAVSRSLSWIREADHRWQVNDKRESAVGIVA